VDSVIRPIVSDVETARVVVLVDLLFVAKKRVLRANYRHGCPRYNDVAIAVNELHVSKKFQLDIRLTNRFNPRITSVRQ
jgi:hypothetical protein